MKNGRSWEISSYGLSCPHAGRHLCFGFGHAGLFGRFASFRTHFMTWCSVFFKLAGARADGWQCNALQSHWRCLGLRFAGAIAQGPRKWLQILGYQFLAAMPGCQLAGYQFLAAISWLPACWLPVTCSELFWLICRLHVSCDASSSHMRPTLKLQSFLLRRDVQVVDPVKLADFCAKCENTRKKRFGFFWKQFKISNLTWQPGNLTCDLATRQAQTSLTWLLN